MRPTDLSAVFSQNNFGNTIEGFKGFRESTALVPGSNAFSNERKRILTLDAANVLTNDGRHLYIPELIAGNWIVTLDAEPTWAVNPPPAPLLAPPGANDQAICPLVAQFGFGSGGAQTVVRCDVVPGNVVSLPATTCQVDIYWGPINDFGIAPSGTLISDNAAMNAVGFPWLPLSTRITATAQRASPSKGPAFFTIYMPRRADFSLSSYQVRYQIPNLARKVRAYDQPGLAVGNSGLYDIQALYSFRNVYQSSTINSRLLRYTGVDMRAFLQDGMTIPKSATEIWVNVPGGVGLAIGGNGGSGSLPVLEFELDL